MKKLLLVLPLILYFLSTGKPFLFDIPQPNGGENLDSVPMALRGTYINNANDTLIVDARSFRLISKKNSFNRVLKKDMVELRKFKDYLVLNVRENNAWLVYPLQAFGNVMDVYGFDAEKVAGSKKMSVDELVDELKKQVEMDEIQEGDKIRYVLKPEKKTFEKLLQGKYAVLIDEYYKTFD